MTQSRLPVSSILTVNEDSLFIVPPKKRARIKSISLVNLTTGTRTINIWISCSGAKQRITPKDMRIPDGGMARDGEEHVIEEHGFILGNADISDSVSFVITGIIEDV